MPTVVLYYPSSPLTIKNDVSGIDDKMWRLAYTAWQFVKKDGWTDPSTDSENNDIQMLIFQMLKL